MAFFLISGIAPTDGDDAVDIPFVVDMSNRYIVMIPVFGFFVSVQ